MCRVAILVSGGLALHGCSGSSAGADGGPMRCPVGDLDSEAELEILSLTDEFTGMPLEEMGEVPLYPAPQGGWMLQIGVRARNLDGCGLDQTTALRDAETDELLSLETRPVRLSPDGDWAESVFNAYSALLACPLSTATRDVDGEPYTIAIAIEDVDGRRASGEITVVPTCPADEGGLSCQCQCAEGYVLGEPCM